LIRRVASSRASGGTAASIAPFAAVLQHAVDRGEITAGFAATAVDLVFGSLWYRLIFGVGRLDEAWADAVTDAIAGSVRA
jgi:Tetracyclin repressor-like, C-terminal domain